MGGGDTLEPRAARAVLFALLGAFSLGIGLLGLLSGELSVSAEWSIETVHVGTVHGSAALALTLAFLAAGGLYWRAFLRNRTGLGRAAIRTALIASALLAGALGVLLYLAYHQGGG